MSGFEEISREEFEKSLKRIGAQLPPESGHDRKYYRRRSMEKLKQVIGERKLFNRISATSIGDFLITSLAILMALVIIIPLVAVVVLIPTVIAVGLWWLVVKMWGAL
jgi:hypothetical protein